MPNNLKHKNTAKDLLQKHPKLIHSDSKKVISHTQRQDDEWIINTLMIEGYEIPFRFKRKKAYQNLKGAQVNLTYYPIIEKLAGMDFEIMNVVRIRKT
tara:strand:+ start:53683 stop:53976 length:294 start_codon:yes stop_codon:yes gene_type:complete